MRLFEMNVDDLRKEVYCNSFKCIKTLSCLKSYGSIVFNEGEYYFVIELKDGTYYVFDRNSSIIINADTFKEHFKG